jgi:hypothetical protein
LKANVPVFDVYNFSQFPFILVLISPTMATLNSRKRKRQPSPWRGSIQLLSRQHRNRKFLVWSRISTTSTRQLTAFSKARSRFNRQSMMKQTASKNIELELPAPLPITRQQFYRNFDQLCQYVKANVTTQELLQMCHKFEDILHRE